MRRAFTIVELLLIAIIVSFIVALVVPLLAGSDNVYTIKCAAQGKQVVNACLLYMAEYDGRFPSQPSQAQLNAADLKFGSWQYNWEGTGSSTWRPSYMATYRYILLRKYIKDDSVWVCPNPRSLYAERYAYGFRSSWLPRSSENFVDGDTGFDDNNGIGRTVEEVEQLDLRGQTIAGSRYMPPHRKIMFMCYALGEWANGNVGPGGFPWLFPSYSHEEGSNFAYVDGHVTWSAMGRGWAPIGYTKAHVDDPPSGDYPTALSSMYTGRMQKNLQRGGANR
jgi:prepilin-type processing-associated H-X9-DG protein